MSFHGSGYLSCFTLGNDPLMPFVYLFIGGLSNFVLIILKESIDVSKNPFSVFMWYYFPLSGLFLFYSLY